MTVTFAVADFSYSYEYIRKNAFFAQQYLYILFIRLVIYSNSSVMWFIYVFVRCVCELWHIQCGLMLVFVWLIDQCKLSEQSQLLTAILLKLLFTSDGFNK